MPTVFNKWNQQKSIKQAILPTVFFFFFFFGLKDDTTGHQETIKQLYSCSSFGVEFEDLVLFSHLAKLE